MTVIPTMYGMSWSRTPRPAPRMKRAQVFMNSIDWLKTSNPKAVASVDEAVVISESTVVKTMLLINRPRV